MSDDTTMLRRMESNPVRAESYARARITLGRVGMDQSSERVEFDGDSSAPRPPTAPG